MISVFTDNGEASIFIRHIAAVAPHPDEGFVIYLVGGNAIHVPDDDMTKFVTQLEVRSI